jgi:hypothetical protein
MAMLKKLSVKSMIIFVLVGLVLWYLYQSDMKPKKSNYQLGSSPLAPSSATSSTGTGAGPSAGVDVSDLDGFAAADLSGTSINLDIGCAMKSGTGLASSLMPREVASQEDYGQFAPNDILKGQNFLDPRQQVGWPETIGGTIRNGNHDLRADPPNPKDQYVWNNSTIVPDLMQRNLFCN